ncbi:PKD domain-containing protein [Nafulsella turpanensis]|uniref:PKD domain-containing protein n=1 Tax=Nafulsella turpanensis TaxID=1265690 RepID=UPI0003496C1D|nr:T9SS type A sorting domain-containing protein [Nafulsella turpanensis]
MKKFYHIPEGHSALNTYCFFLCCLFGSLLASPAAYAQLSGTYTIGGNDASFATLTEAIKTLEREGISAAVTFQIRPGVYQEQVVINNIPGSSCSAPVKFEGTGKSPAEVALKAPEGTESVIQLNGVDGIEFRHLGIGNDILTAPGTDCFRLENNLLTGSVVARSSAEARSHLHVYRNNYFQTGKIVKVNEAPWNPAAPVFDEGLTVEGNRFDQGGIEVEGQQGFSISKNEIDAGGGISVTNSWYGKEINENKLTSGAGIILNSGAAAEFTGNRVSIIDGGGIGLMITTGKSIGNEILIANNLVDVYGYDSRGHNYYPISNLVGLDITNPYPNHVKLYHNTIQVAGHSDDVPNYTLSLAGEESSFSVFNNIIVNNSGGTGIKVANPASVVAMDYNALYMGYADLFASWGGQEISSFAEWQHITDFDSHSIKVNPGTPTEPAEALAGAGKYQKAVPLDFFGQTRNNPPTIGAVEKAPVSNPVSGVYTIGGENADFASFTEALAFIESGTPVDSLHFLVRPGVYQEQLTLGSYGEEAKITFQGESGDSTDVVLTYPFGPALLLEGTSNFTFRNMTVATGIQIQASENLLFENNLIEGGVEVYTTNKDIYRNNLFVGAGISKSGRGAWQEGGTVHFSTDHSLAILGNTFKVGSSAISLFAQSAFLVNENNILMEDKGENISATGISVRSSSNILEISNNSVVSSIPNTTGINFEGSWLEGELPQELNSNKIILKKGGTGINFYYTGGNPQASLVANNMITINTSEDKSTGVKAFLLPGEINLKYNSIYLHGEDKNSQILSIESDTGEPNVHLYNNILANLAGGVVLSGDFDGTTDKIASSDYNDLFTSGDTLAIWDGEVVPDLEAWQRMTHFDSNSLSVAPDFESAVNLIPQNMTLKGAGMSVSGVNEDFFGKERKYPPTIGAVELTDEAENQLPFVNAGEDKIVTLPLESLYLRGTGKDPDGVFRKFLWEKISGPSVTMLDASTANTQLQDLVAGEYVFRFTATDNLGASASDEIKLVVKESNLVPVISAGIDRTVFLPLEKLILSGTGRDPDGRFTAFLWEKVSGPAVIMRQQRTANLILTELVEGTYLFRFSATDNAGATVSDEMTLTVQRRNQVPVVSAGADKIIYLPQESIKLSGTGMDTDGVFRDFLWEKVSGPSVRMEQANTANLFLHDLVAGIYIFRFTATDNQGATASDEMMLEVKEVVYGDKENSIRLTTYPNTFQRYINLAIQAEEPDDYHIEIYDLMGKVYYRSSFSTALSPGQPLHIDLSEKNMQKGIYLIRVENKSRSYREVVKVIKD